MKPPKTIKVGYATYTLEGATAHDSWANGVYGDTNHAKLLVRYNRELPSQQAGETVLHEVMHCVYDCWKVGKDDDEEAVVSKFAAGLATVMRDNPKLLEWIQESLG